MEHLFRDAAYLLGHAPSGAVVGMEPHSAKTGEVSTVIQKRKQALVQLREHLVDGARIARWLWVSSGAVEFQPFDKAILLLDQNGITFAGRKVLAKHLPAAVLKPSSAEAKAQK